MKRTTIPVSKLAPLIRSPLEQEGGKMTKMNRSDIWTECVNSLIRNLIDAPSAAAREVGKAWKWAFQELHEHPERYNQLQDSSPEQQATLVRKFLTTCELRAQEKEASDEKMVEYAIDRSVPLADAPGQSQVSSEIADALAAFGMFLGHRGHNTIDAPSRFPYTAALFGFDREVFRDILESKQIPEGQRTILEEVAKYIPRGRTNEEYFRRCEAAARIESLFGFSKRLLTATDVYQRGWEFYNTSSRLGPVLTMTFSNTSGLWNPLERYGTAKFDRLYGIREGAKVKYKDSFRSTNFVDGILNPSLACRRLYLFNDSETWKAFRHARSVAADVPKFDADTAVLLDQVCARMEAATGTLHLAKVKNWSEFRPLSLVTRVSSDVIMFSNRGSDLAISHAFWCRLTERGAAKAKTQRRVLSVLETIAEMASGGSLPVLRSLGPFLETLLGKAESFRIIQERVSGERLRRLLDEEPVKVLSKLEDRFGLKVEYITPSILRSEVRKVIQEMGEGGSNN